MIRKPKETKPRSPAVADIELGRRIRERRNEIKLSQTDLADALGVSFQQVQKYENGKNRVTAYRLALIASALKIKPEDFFKSDLPPRVYRALSTSKAKTRSACLRLIARSRIRRRNTRWYCLSRRSPIVAHSDLRLSMTEEPSKPKQLTSAERKARKEVREAEAAIAMAEHERAQKDFNDNRERLRAERLARDAASKERG